MNPLNRNALLNSNNYNSFGIFFGNFDYHNLDHDFRDQIRVTFNCLNGNAYFVLRNGKERDITSQLQYFVRIKLPISHYRIRLCHIFKRCHLPNSPSHSLSLTFCYRILISFNSHSIDNMVSFYLYIRIILVMQTKTYNMAIIENELIFIKLIMHLLLRFWYCANFKDAT